jgi:hypothetical protein
MKHSGVLLLLLLLHFLLLLLLHQGKYHSALRRYRRAYLHCCEPPYKTAHLTLLPLLLLLLLLLLLSVCIRVSTVQRCAGTARRISTCPGPPSRTAHLTATVTQTSMNRSGLKGVGEGGTGLGVGVGGMGAKGQYIHGCHCGIHSSSTTHGVGTM